MEKIHDQHVHTIYSRDSKEPMINYINKAIDLGLSYFVMTDHLDFDLGIHHENWIADYKNQRKELDKLQKEVRNRIVLLQGIEFGYKKEYINDIKEILNSNDFDLVNMSIHDYNRLDFYYEEYFINNGIDFMIETYLKEYIEAVSSDLDFDVVSHIDYAFKTAKRIDNSLCFSKYEALLIELFKLIISKNKTLEINTKVQEGINDDNHVKYILSLYYSLNGRDITISSDAHTLNRYYSSIEKYLAIAKDLGYTHLCYFIDRKKHYFYII